LAKKCRVGLKNVYITPVLELSTTVSDCLWRKFWPEYSLLQTLENGRPKINHDDQFFAFKEFFYLKKGNYLIEINVLINDFTYFIEFSV